MNEIKAVILAGGEGTRLQPLTLHTHKGMVPILNRPFLEHALDHLRNHGIREVILALCHLHHQIVDYFGDGSAFGVKLHYVVEESPLGTAGAVRNTAHLLDNTFLVLNGDIYTDLDLKSLLAFHREQGALATIALTQVEDPSPYGVVETGPGGRVLRFLEKPRPGETPARDINAGTYVLEPQALRHIPRGQPYMFERGLFPSLLEQGLPLFAYHTQSYWMDMGTPQRYLALHLHLLLKNGAALASDSRIHPQAILRGPVMMGPGCRVAAQAQVVGPAALGPSCHLGPRSRVERAVLWHGVRVGEGAIITGAILGNGCHIGDRAWVGPGCVLGDGVALAPGTRLEPGTLLWPDPPSGGPPL